MRMSESFFITRKELPNDEVSISSKYLIKSGMIYKNDNGIYTYLPFGLRVLENIKKIIREEMKENKAEEVLLPSLISNDVLKDSGKSKSFNEEIFNIVSRNNKEYSLCPTHEDLFAMIVKDKIKSYRDLHFTLFQISNKFRDEIKTEYGLVRKKEFYMADAYSFDANDGGLDISYDKMYQTFNKIFKRMDLDVLVSRANPLSLNGVESEEFQAICNYGDNKIVKCKSCPYCTNIEYAYSLDKYKKESIDIKKKELIRKENFELKSDYIKSIVIKVDEEYKMILLKNNAQINTYRLSKIFPNSNIEFANNEDLEKLGITNKYIGPIDIDFDIIADNEIKLLQNASCGSNKEGYYYINVNPGIDFKVSKYADIKLFDRNSLCPRCKSECDILNGIEVGHIFKLEDNYSKVYDLKYLNESNEIEYVHQGSYGIGIDRCIDAIVEQHHDENGIIWPMEVSPFKVCIVIINTDDKDALKYAKKLHDKLNDLKIDTLLDDRNCSAGIKFNDMDLIGIPIRITVGNKLNEKLVEYKLRDSNESKDIDIDIVISKITNDINRSY